VKHSVSTMQATKVHINTQISIKYLEQLFCERYDYAEHSAISFSDDMETVRSWICKN